MKSNIRRAGASNLERWNKDWQQKRDPPTLHTHNVSFWSAHVVYSKSYINFKITKHNHLVFGLLKILGKDLICYLMSTFHWKKKQLRELEGVLQTTRSWDNYSIKMNLSMFPISSRNNWGISLQNCAQFHIWQFRQDLLVSWGKNHHESEFLRNDTYIVQPWTRGGSFWPVWPRYGGDYFDCAVLKPYPKTPICLVFGWYFIWSFLACFTHTFTAHLLFPSADKKTHCSCRNWLKGLTRKQQQLY